MMTQKISRQARRNANAILIALGCQPVKEHRAPREKKDRYVVTSWTTDGEMLCKTPVPTMEMARKLCKSGVARGFDMSIEAIGDDSIALESYLANGRVIK